MYKLQNIDFLEEGYWIYYWYDNRLNHLYINGVITNKYYSENLIGIDNLDNFFKFLETRNKKSNFKNNDLKNFDRILKEKEIDLNKEYDYEEILEIINTIKHL